MGYGICDKEYRKRVVAFWKWFNENESKLAEYIDNCSAKEIAEFFMRGLVEICSERTIAFVWLLKDKASSAEIILLNTSDFNIYINAHEVTVSPKGDIEKAFLTSYLVKAMPDSLKHKWRFLPWAKQNLNVSLCWDDNIISVDSAFVAYNGNNSFDINFCIDELIDHNNFSDKQANEIAGVLLSLSLGENCMSVIGYVFASNAKEDKRGDIVKLSELRQYIDEHIPNGITSNDCDPLQNTVAYDSNRGEDKDVICELDESDVFNKHRHFFHMYTDYMLCCNPQYTVPRDDAVNGYSRLFSLVQDYYRRSLYTYTALAKFGAVAAYLTITRPHSEDDSVLVDMFISKMAQELLEAEIGEVIGRVTGKNNMYIDLLLYDVEEFNSAIGEFLENCKLTVTCDSFQNPLSWE